MLPENMGPHLHLNAVNSVQRFDGRNLGDSPHIAVLGSCKLGNFVATLPLLRLLRRRYPEARIDFWGSEATADFERALCEDGQPLDWRISWDQTNTKGLERHSSRLSAISKAAAAAARRSGPTRPGDQLRRLQPTDSNTDQLASNQPGLRGEVCGLMDGHHWPGVHCPNNAFSLIPTGTHQPFSPATPNTSIAITSPNCCAAWHFLNPTATISEKSPCPGRNHHLRLPPQCSSTPLLPEPPRSGHSKLGHRSTEMVF